MNKLYSRLPEFKKMYDEGINILERLRKENNTNKNDLESILISYDLQSGSYVESFRTSNNKKKIRYCQEVVEKLSFLGPIESMLIAGTGESITLTNVASRMSPIPNSLFGFDISWSRIKYGKEFVQEFNIPKPFLSTGDIFCMPYADNSIELVMSNHSLEPNGGREKEALQELYRVSSKYIVVNEPCYELGNEAARSRIDHHGYVKNLHIAAKELGYEIIKHELFDHPTNSLNPTSCLIIKKQASSISPYKIACPISKKELVRHDSCYSCEESMLSYPIIQGIPCLVKDNAILTAHFHQDAK